MSFVCYEAVAVTMSIRLMLLAIWSADISVFQSGWNGVLSLAKAERVNREVRALAATAA